MTLSSTLDCPESDVERRATLVRVYAYLIEQGHLRKKQNTQPAVNSPVVALSDSTQQDDKACPNA